MLALFAVDILPDVEMVPFLLDDRAKLQGCVRLLLTDVAGESHGLELLAVQLIKHLQKVFLVFELSEASVQ